MIYIRLHNCGEVFSYGFCNGDFGGDDSARTMDALIN